MNIDTGEVRDMTLQDLEAMSPEERRRWIRLNLNEQTQLAGIPMSQRMEALKALREARKKAKTIRRWADKQKALNDAVMAAELSLTKKG